jgi:8-oxo-dGTP pyrophosphatase MutT (NUDIX family)
MNNSVGTVFFARSSQRFLFLLRAGASFDNTWAFVGGKVETGESVIDALKREITEEIGYDSNLISKHIPIEKFTNTKKNFSYHTFVSVIENEFIPNLNDEHKGFAWTTIDGWPKPLHPGVFTTINTEEIQDKIRTIKTIF